MVTRKNETNFEAELTCKLCYELFVIPLSLNCGHAFCQWCINQWKLKSKNNFDCPICREPITILSRAWALENLISSWYKDNMNENIKKERTKLIHDRYEINNEVGEMKIFGLEETIPEENDRFIPINTNVNEDTANNPKIKFSWKYFLFFAFWFFFLMIVVYCIFGLLDE